MSIPPNRVKQALAERRQIIGIWSSLCSPLVAELLADAGFDCVVLDTEHSPNDLPNIFNQLQAVNSGGAAGVVRLAANDPVLAKWYLDAGAQTLIFPFVQSVREAERAIQSVTYPPGGVRGVAGTTRANRFGRVASEYFVGASQEIAVIVQAETREALANVRSIGQVPGVDAIFFGPSDLAASLGHIGQPTHAEVRKAIQHGIDQCQEEDIPTAILAPSSNEAAHWIGQGVNFVVVANDIAMLATASRDAVSGIRKQMEVARR